jgi:predicted secreted protein
MNLKSMNTRNILFTIKIVAAQAIITLASSAFSQTVQDTMRYREPLNIVQLSANAAVDVQQDILTISMSTTREAADASAVQTQLKTALDAALTEAKKTASTTTSSSTSQHGQLDARTGNFSLYPRYGKDGKINGWQGTTELVLEGRDFAKISVAAGKIQTLTIANVAFSLSREQRTKAETEAQNTAIERFRAKAGDIAKSFGMGSYNLREIAINAGDQGYTPRPRVAAMSMKLASADEAVPVEAGKSTVIVTVSGAVQLR